MIRGFLIDSLNADASLKLIVVEKLPSRHESSVGGLRQSLFHPQAFNEKRPLVGSFFNQLGRRLARAVPRPGFDSD